MVNMVIHYKHFISCLCVRYLYSETGVNMTLQAIGACIKDSVNKLAYDGVVVRDPNNHPVAWLTF